MIEDPVFNSKNTGPSWKLAVQVWNRHADNNDNIFYKVSHQLLAIYIEGPDSKSFAVN